MGSLVSFLFKITITSRPSRDVVIAGHQQTTQDWWQNRRGTFDLVASQLVIREARSGDSVERICRSRDYEPVIICTPEELMET